ncbi:uncharacterized protein LOC110008133 [Amborella trichopoda]|uniref:uncharacterized protein LOC110008133 n=1 Tax=Amborella trichopoda TaxID=13333 RepID=UPI0009BFE6D1|nr:uncharacterized protein LOC110008133 [Amborella trichopoda]|eukprot:XP_020529428.1 uncharacterized protein LOC110008133 [Amborella trichopoda]
MLCHSEAWLGCIKRTEIKNITGFEQEIEMIAFFLANTKTLEKLIVKIGNGLESQEGFELAKQLNFFPRASNHAKFFKTMGLKLIGRALSHEILRHILSLLPIRETRRTSILFKRWSDLWASTLFFNVENDIDPSSMLRMMQTPFNRMSSIGSL